MTRRLYRCYGAGYLHFITTSCYKRRLLLGSGCERDLFLEVLEQVRRRYRLVVVGYVVMPEHVHLLLSEPERKNLSVVMQVVKQSFARRLLRKIRSESDSPLLSMVGDEGQVWERRFYDFAVWTKDKHIEKLRYIHRNPVKRGLVLEPQDWRWSSFRHYARTERRDRCW
jgi:putative transposase